MYGYWREKNEADIEINCLEFKGKKLIQFVQFILKVNSVKGVVVGLIQLFTLAGISRILFHENL